MTDSQDVNMGKIPKHLRLGVEFVYNHKGEALVRCVGCNRVFKTMSAYDQHYQNMGEFKDNFPI